MFNKRKIAALLFCALFLFGTGGILYAQANQKKEYKVRIVWDAVSGSGGYLVEIRDKKNVIIFSKEAATNEVYPRLPLGDYTMRITVYDKFMKVADATPWAKINVKYTEAPMFEKISPEQIVIGESDGELVIRGDNFNKDTTVEIQGPPAITVKNLSFVSEEEMKVSFDPAKAEPGLYTIIISNGEKKTATAKNVLKVKSPAVEEVLPVVKFEVSSISPSVIVIPSSTTSMTVKGKNFPRDSRVFVLQDGNEYSAVTKFNTDSELIAEIPSESLKLGRCDLIVRQGKASAKYDGIPVSIKNDGLLGLGGLNIAAGYSGFAIMSDEWSEYFKNSNKGFNFYLGRHFYKSYQAKGMTVFGAELDTTYASFQHKQNSSRWKSSLTVFQNRLGLYLSNDMRIPVNLMLRADGGLAYSKLTVKYSGASETKKSFDFLASFGASVKWNILKSFYVEGGADLGFIMYKSSRMDGVRYFARTGLSL